VSFCITIWKREHAYKFTRWCDPPWGKRRQRVSLAEYILVLSVYSHLLQMISFMMASARPVSIPLGMRTKPLGTVL